MPNNTKKKATDSFKKICKEHNFYATPQRLHIYKILIESKDHPCADTIFKKVRENLPNISFDTVNRTLLTFAEHGIIHIVEGYGDSKRFDPDLRPHHHFRCLACHTIIDFSENTYDTLKIPEEIKNKYVVLNKRVIIEGLCDKCRKKKICP